MQVYMNYIYDHSINFYYLLSDVNDRNYLRDTFRLDIFRCTKMTFHGVSALVTASILVVRTWQIFY